MNNRDSLLLFTLFAVINSVLVACSHPDKKYNLRKAKRLTLMASNNMYYRQEEEVTFVKGKPSPDWYWKKGAPLLTYYVEKNDKKTVRCLLNHGANPNIPGVYNGRHYNPPLFEANSADMIRLLIGKGADLSLRIYDKTALHLAICHNKSAYTVAALCQAGFDPRTLSTRPYAPQMDAMDMVIDRARFMRDNEHMLKIGVLYWYGADIEKASNAARFSVKGSLSAYHCPEDTSRYAYLVQTFLARLSRKRKNTPGPSAGIVAPHLGNIMALSMLVSDYCGDAPYLTVPEDIDAWQELIEE